MNCDVGKATVGLENSCDIGEVTERLTEVKQRKGRRMSCDIGQVTEGLENSCDRKVGE